MKNLHKNIAVRTLSENCGLISPRSRFGNYNLDAPATSLMVDFTRVHAITASESMSVHDALELMRLNRIRALMVIDSNGEFAGIVTAMDLMGRKPMAYANEAGIRWSEVQVKNVMLGKGKMKAIAWSDVEKATLEDVLQVLKSLRLQHLPVVEGADDAMKICGLFSATDFKRALDIDMDITSVANSFADLERVINKDKEVM
jgi:CBS domain-containing protein